MLRDPSIRPSRSTVSRPLHAPPCASFSATCASKPGRSFDVRGGPVWPDPVVTGLSPAPSKTLHTISLSRRTMLRSAAEWHRCRSKLDPSRPLAGSASVPSRLGLRGSRHRSVVGFEESWSRRRLVTFNPRNSRSPRESLALQAIPRSEIPSKYPTSSSRKYTPGARLRSPHLVCIDLRTQSLHEVVKAVFVEKVHSEGMAGGAGQLTGPTHRSSCCRRFFFPIAMGSV